MHWELKIQDRKTKFSPPSLRFGGNQSHSCQWSRTRLNITEVQHNNFKGILNEPGAKQVSSSNLSLAIDVLCSQVVLQVQHLEFLWSLQTLFLPENILLPTGGASIYKAEFITLIEGLQMLQEQGERIILSTVVVSSVSFSSAVGSV